MKKGKRLISTLCTVTMLISCCGYAAFAEESEATADSAEIVADTANAEDEAAEIYYQEDFESYNVDARTLSGYSGSAKTNQWKVVEENGNKMFEMHVNTKSDMHLDKGFTNVVEGQFVFEIGVMLKDYGEVVKNIELNEPSGGARRLVTFNSKGQILTADGKVISNYALNKLYKLAFIVDTDADTLSVYVNGKNRLRNHKYEIGSAKAYRVHLTGVAGESKLWIDNLKLYSGNKITDKFVESKTSSNSVAAIDVKSIMKDAVAMYEGKSNTLLHGLKDYMSDDKAIMPYSIDGTYMVPVRYFSESIGGEVTWIAESRSVKITCGEKEVMFKANSNEASCNGEAIQLEQPVQYGGGGSLYASVSDLCRLFDKFLHTEINGVIIYSDKDMTEILDWQNNTKVMRKICESYMFDDFTGEEMTQIIKEKFPNKTHPRLVFTEDKFAMIRKELADPDGDPVYKKMFEGLKRSADAYLSEPTSGYEIRDGIRLLYVVRENAPRMLACALMYNLTGEEKYAERAYLEMYTCATFKDWNPYHFLDVGEMASCMGFAYDWLYNWMNDSQRKIIRDAMVRKSIYPIMEDFNDVQRSRSWNWRGELADNWCLVISGVGCSTLAYVDELEGKDLEYAQYAMVQTLLDSRRALSLFSPLGGYEEGYSYWAYAMKYFGFYIESLMSISDNDYGYVDIPGMKFTNDFINSTNGSVSVFSYHDSNFQKVTIPVQLMFTAKMFGTYSDAQPVINNILTYGVSGENAVCGFIHYDPALLTESSSSNALDTYMPISEVATMRSGWSSDDTYVGFHCDNPMGDGKGHSHNDTGTFVLDAMGETWFMDLGAEGYNVANRNQSYRLRAEGHNTVVFNPEAGYALKSGGTGKIIKTEFKEKGGFAIGEMTDAYESKHGVKSFRRGVKLDTYRSKTTVQDEIVLEDKADFWWFAHTPAEVEITDGGKSAILTKGDKRLIAKIEHGDNAVFSVMDAVPLPTSPVVTGGYDDSHYKKLVIHIPECESINLCVTFANYDFSYNSKLYETEFVPLDEWSIEDGPFIERKYAQLKEITVNGKPLEGFSPDVYNYTVSLDEETSLNTFVAAASDFGEVTVTQKEGLCGEAEIYLDSSNEEYSDAVYKIFFNIPATLEQPTNKQKIQPVKVRANAIPEPVNNPDNTVDGSLNTRWSCAGYCWIEYDLGKIYELDSVGVAFMDGTKRTAQFDITLSEDGNTWTTYYSGDALSTLELDNHKLFGAKARYVRIYGRGYNNMPDAYTSITEFAAYKQ